MTELETQAIEHKTEIKLITLTTIVSIIVISLKLILMTTTLSKADEIKLIFPNITSATTHSEYLKEYAQNQNRPPKNNGRRQSGPPPKEAIEICKSQSENTNCTFIDKRHNKKLTGACKLVRNNTMACVPEKRPPPKKG